MTHSSVVTVPATAVTTSRRRGSPALVLAVLGLVPALLLGLAGAGPSRAAAPAEGWIRVGHLSIGTDGVDIRLTPFEGGGPTDLTDVGYGEFTDYLRVPEGLYTVAVRPTGSEMSVPPMIDETVEVTADGASTLVATRSGDRVVSRLIADDLTPPADGEAKVRLISGVGGEQDLTARVVDGPVLAEDVSPGSDTGYAAVGAQTWSIELSVDGARRRVDRVALQPGGIYTLVVVDAAAGGGLRLQPVQDVGGSPVMPRGGVDAGAGGSVGRSASDATDGGLTTWGAAAIAGSLLAAGIAVAVARTAPPRRGRVIR